MKIFKAFLKQRETLLGIYAAIAFQLIFVLIWLTAYDGVYERTDQLTVAVINEDAGFGEEIKNELEHSTLFDVRVLTDLHEAKQEMDDRSINMIIHLPDKMTEQLQSNENATINYYINQSTPSLTKQMMENIAGEINGEVNQHVREAIRVQMAEKIPQTIAAQSEQKDMVEQVANQVMEIVQESSPNTPVKENIVKTNDREGFAATMVPLLIVLASYIGAMLVSQHLQFAENRLKITYRKPALFIGRQVINIMVAITISLLTVGLMNLFNIQMDHSFFVLWGFQATLMFSFLALSQVFVMLFGNFGMIFNIALTAIQLVSSGAIVPRELLSPFYERLGSILPATYGVNSYFSLIYGGGNLALDVKYLFVIIGSTLIIVIGGKIGIYLRGVTNTPTSSGG